jgi:hypothetical protein
MAKKSPTARTGFTALLEEITISFSSLWRVVDHEHLGGFR